MINRNTVNTDNKSPLLLHGLFRCGSTFVFNRMRASDEYHCYYEPLHHDLVRLRRHNLDLWGYDSGTTSKVNHPALDKPHFDEYRTCFSESGGRLPNFEKKYSYDDYYGVTGNEFRKYIDNLIQSAPAGKRPVLQFNRTGMRVNWFAENMKNCMNVSMVREPRDQFDSYLKTSKGVFLAINLIIVSRSTPNNPHTSLTRELCVPGYSSGNAMDEIRHYMKICKTISLEGHYRIFFELWAESCLSFNEYADFVIDMSRAQTEAEYQTSIEDTLGFSGLFDGYDMKAKNRHSLSDRKLSTIEHGVLKNYNEDAITSLRAFCPEYNSKDSSRRVVSRLKGIFEWKSKSDTSDNIPVVSIITPSYNQVEYIEDTIQSVIGQAGRFYLEYIVMDGLSDDGTVDILEKYAQYINTGRSSEINGVRYYVNEHVKCKGISMKYVSAKDDGQANAINSGFRQSSGDIMAWLNSDDVYYSDDCIENVVKRLGDKHVHFVYGRGVRMDKYGVFMREENYVNNFRPSKIKLVDLILQPSAFWKRIVYEKVGYLDEKYNYVFDWEYWMRISEHFELVKLDKLLSCYRVYDDNKTTTGGSRRTGEIKELLVLYGSYGKEAKRLNGIA